MHQRSAGAPDGRALRASPAARGATLAAAIGVVGIAAIGSVVALRLDIGCSGDATDAVQNVVCDPRAGALDVLRAALLVLAPLAALAGAGWALTRGGHRALKLGGALALVLVMAAGDVGGAMTPDEQVPRISGLTAERSGGSVGVGVSLTDQALVLIDFGASGRRPLSVSQDGRPADPRAAGGFGPGYLLGPGRHRLSLATPADARVVRVEAVLPGAGNQRDRSRGVVQVPITPQ